MIYITAQKENIEDIIKLRLMYLIEYNKSIEENILGELKLNIRNYLNEHLNKDCFIEIAYENNEIISSAILNVMQKVPSPKFLNSFYGEIYGVYTNPNYRKRGIATELVKRIINNNKNKDLSFIQLDASILGANIYEKCGFKYVDSEYKEMKYYYE